MGGDLENGLSYFELDRVDELKKAYKYIFNVYAFKRNFYFALCLQLLAIYYICHTIQENNSLKEITKDNYIFYIITFVILLRLSFTLFEIDTISFSAIIVYICYTIVLACCFSLFTQYQPEMGFNTLYYTIIITFVLGIFANFSTLEESGYSIVTSLVVFTLILSVIINKNNYHYNIIGVLITCSFCFYSLYKLSNLDEKEKVEGYYLILSFQLYTCYLLSFLVCIHYIASNCCQGMINCCEQFCNCSKNCCNNPCCNAYSDVCCECHGSNNIIIINSNSHHGNCNCDSNAECNCCCDCNGCDCGGCDCSGCDCSGGCGDCNFNN